MNNFEQKLVKIYHDINVNQYVLLNAIIEIIRKLVGTIKDIKSFINLMILKISLWKKDPNHSEKINVIFLYQIPEMWNKLKPVYEEFIKDENFNVIILAIPVKKRKKTG